MAGLLAVASASGQQSTTPASGAQRAGSRSIFAQPDPLDFNDHAGWTQIFDGKSLNGWEGAPDIWHVEDGAIVGISTPEHPVGNTNIIWRGGQPANFEMKLEIKLEGDGANGGVQYRSSNDTVIPAAKAPRTGQLTDAQKQQMEQRQALARKYARWRMQGYQADFDYANRYTGQVFDEGTGRGILAWRGQIVEATQGQNPRLLGSLGSSDDLKAFIKTGQWNQYEIVADGNTLVHILNGHVMAIFVDNDPTASQKKGLLGLEIEGPGNVKISYRNLWLKSLP